MVKGINRRQALITLGLGTSALGLQGMYASFSGGQLLEKAPSVGVLLSQLKLREKKSQNRLSF